MHPFIKAATLACSLTAALALPLAATAAPVATINFNAAPANVSGSVTQSGFTATGSSSYVTLGGSYWCSPACAYDGSNYYFNYGNAVTVTSNTGALFALSSFDAGESHSGAAYAAFSATSIRVTGTLASGGTVSASFVLDGINDGMGALNDFQTFTLPTTFSGLNRVVFTPLGGSIRYYGLDNIVIGDGSVIASNQSNIPEPTTLGLVGLALLLGGRSARRLQRQALAAV